MGFSDLWRREVGVGIRGNVGFFITSVASAIAAASALKVSVVQSYVMSLTGLGSSYYMYVPIVQGFISLLSLYVGFLSDVRRSRKSLVADGALVMIAGVVFLSISVRYALGGLALAASVSIFILGIYITEVPILACIVDAYPPIKRVSVSSRVVYFIIFTSFITCMLYSSLILLFNWRVFSVTSLASLIIGTLALLGIVAVEEVRVEGVRRSFSSYVRRLFRGGYALKYLIFVFSTYVIVVTLALTTQYLITELTRHTYVPLGTTLPKGTYLDFTSLYVLFNVTALVGAATFPHIYEYLGPNVTPPLAVALFFLPLTATALRVGLGTAYLLALISGFGGGLTLALAIMYPALNAEPETAAGWFAIYEVGGGASYIVVPTLLHITLSLVRSYVVAVPAIVTAFGIAALVTAVLTYSAE